MISIQLKQGKDKPIRQLHPWIFSGAIEKIKGKPENGEIIRILNDKSEFLAYGFYNGQSKMAVRVLEWDEEIEVNEEWWRMRVRKAVNARKHILDNEDITTCRLIFSEADYLPGFIADKYADFISVQILSSGIERVKNILLDELQQLLNPKGIFDKSDETAREQEGLSTQNSVLFGEQPPEFLRIKENGINYEVNITGGQKSGFYCDQRDNRKTVAEYAKNKTILDCFSYSGGFTLNALKACATHVTSLDSSALAIETLQRNILINGFDATRNLTIQCDVNAQLRKFRASGQKFDMIILDPPKYAPSRSALDRASRAYKDLNRLAMLLLHEGGLLATFSCSGAVNMETFKQIIAWAALDAGREVQFIYQFCQPADHPIRASFPEGEYLKGLLCRVS